MRKKPWFFTTSPDGENPAIMLASMMLGLIAAAVIIWLIAGTPIPKNL